MRKRVTLAYTHLPSFESINSVVFLDTRLQQVIHPNQPSEEKQFEVSSFTDSLPCATLALQIIVFNGLAYCACTVEYLS
ncbi:hypothetical protein SAY86_024185 [Trapa natans]|uniref:Uncharacterized protein n=1 Tax=Trapa natans TaxID=22666 RepID=A0AAN7MBX9_TRANT|nr:hypothetical protein SAY86_024185 [Trapa natans]